MLITHTFTQIILKWIGFFSYLSDLKLTSHHTYVMHYLILFVTGGILCYPTLQEMLSVKGWLIGRWTLKKKQTNKKQNWLFTEVANVAHEQFKWGFHNAGDS